MRHIAWGQLELQQKPSDNLLGCSGPFHGISWEGQANARSTKDGQQ